MKKAKLLFSILLVCTLVLVGCVKKDKKEDKKKEKPAPATAGESLDIKLESNPSTGYSWTYELEGDNVVVLTSKYEEGENCEDRDGCPGYEIFTVTATAPGHVNFKLIYTFAESDDSNALEADYDITIDKDLKITETHTGSYFEK
ncbi:MAG: protease inhibitor I42 family protein [Bacilli bacterium]|nr:protease inhibitor I42 family protein [Bacilli bacterium]